MQVGGVGCAAAWACASAAQWREVAWRCVAAVVTAWSGAAARAAIGLWWWPDVVAAAWRWWRGWRTAARGLRRRGDGGLAGERRRGIELGHGGGSRWRDAGETEEKLGRRYEQDAYMTNGPAFFLNAG